MQDKTGRPNWTTLMPTYTNLMTRSRIIPIYTKMVGVFSAHSIHSIQACGACIRIELHMWAPLRLLALCDSRLYGIITSSFLYGTLNIHLYALYKQTAEWGKHSSIVLKSNTKLEALRERRPPWPRQIITLILPTVKMLSLFCERLPTPLKKKKKKKKKGSGSLPSPRSGYATTITVFSCSFTHLTIPRSPRKFNQFFLVLLRTRP